MGPTCANSAPGGLSTATESLGCSLRSEGCRRAFVRRYRSSAAPLAGSTPHLLLQVPDSWPETTLPLGHVREEWPPGQTVTRAGYPEPRGRRLGWCCHRCSAPGAGEAPRPHGGAAAGPRVIESSSPRPGARRGVQCSLGRWPGWRPAPVDGVPQRQRRRLAPGTAHDPGERVSRRRLTPGPRSVHRQAPAAWTTGACRRWSR